MSKSKIVASWNRGRDGDLAILTRRVLDALRNNLTFPNPPHAYADVEKALEDYLVALSNAAGRDRTMVSRKDDQQAILREMLADLANYVSQTSKRDKTLLSSSGFDLVKEKSSATPLQPVGKVLAELGEAGEVTLKVDKVAGARTYLFEFTVAPITDSSVWTSIRETNRVYLLTGLASAVKYAFRVGAVGLRGKTVYSDPVTKVIQ